jgi:hypothetical protein
VEHQEERDHLEDLGVDGRTISNRVWLCEVDSSGSDHGSVVTRVSTAMHGELSASAHALSWPVVKRSQDSCVWCPVFGSVQASATPTRYWSESPGACRLSVLLHAA